MEIYLSVLTTLLVYSRSRENPLNDKLDLLNVVDINHP